MTTVIADGDDAEICVVGQEVADHPGRQHGRELQVADQVSDDEDADGDEQRVEGEG